MAGFAALSFVAAVVFFLRDREARVHVNYVGDQLAQANARLYVAMEKANALSAENEALKREVQSLRGGDHPAMAAALANAPSLFEEARRRQAIVDDILKKQAAKP